MEFRSAEGVEAGCEYLRHSTHAKAQQHDALRLLQVITTIYMSRLAHPPLQSAYKNCLLTADV